MRRGVSAAVTRDTHERSPDRQCVTSGCRYREYRIMESEEER